MSTSFLATTSWTQRCSSSKCRSFPVPSRVTTPRAALESQQLRTLKLIPNSRNRCLMPSAPVSPPTWAQAQLHQTTERRSSAVCCSNTVNVFSQLYLNSLSRPSSCLATCPISVDLQVECRCVKFNSPLWAVPFGTCPSNVNSHTKTSTLRCDKLRALHKRIK